MVEVVAAVVLTAAVVAGMFIGYVLRGWLAPLYADVVGPATTGVGYRASHRRRWRW